MPDARLEVTDALGRRIVPIAKGQFEIGRRETNDLRLAGSEVSRDHAEIVLQENKFLLRDRNSRYGTYVNGEQVTERQLVHGDRVRLGRSGGAEMVFLLADSAPPVERATTTAVGDLRQIAALLEGLRALGSGRVLDDVLSLVLDSAIEVSGAERGFIMLAGPTGELEFKMARGRGRTTLSGGSFATSRKIPEEVFRTGEPRIVADLLDGDLANVHMGTVALGIRNVLCVPLRLVRYLDKAEAVGEERRIGVLYLDSREKGSLLSNSTRAALETLATEAAVAIENARLYRETMEKARMEQEMRIAAEIQQALLPKGGRTGVYFKAAAASLPCRSIGGDFYDYVDLSDGSLGFALGDVAGKGPPAALLSAMMQGIFAAQAAGSDPPSQTITRVNLALYRRGIESRFVTLMYGALYPDGRLRYCNAGHNPPLVIGPSGFRRLERGGPIVGLFEGASYEEETVTLLSGDWLIVFSDGVSEALSAAGDEYGESRIVTCVQNNVDLEPQGLLEAMFSDVRDFARGAAQSDDITAMVLRFRG
ncbi:MAG TPA: SpoIIE family protein phosphatase [Vicinamibacterales bacterium]|jgi:phosphoserine phosphatase RsbU/P|nr:SpoIIE family protein phosphatase [Vicinamibacterales bacterium]